MEIGRLWDLRANGGEYEGRECRCCCSDVLDDWIKWLSVVNRAVNLLFTREAGNVTGMLRNCQRLKNSAACT